jgi:DNA/RNA endonuclease G (NUC1)
MLPPSASSFPDLQIGNFADIPEINTAAAASETSDIPIAFYKVVVDPKTHEAIGFVMKQKAIAKQPLTPFLTAISDIEKAAHITLLLPAGYTEATALWSSDLAGWKKAKKAAC